MTQKATMVPNLMTKIEKIYVSGCLTLNIAYWISVLYYRRIDIALLISALLIAGSFSLKDRVIYLHRLLKKQEAKKRIGHWRPLSDGIETLRAKISHIGGMPPLSYSLTFMLAVMSGMKYGWREWVTAIPAATFVLLFVSVQVAIAAAERETNSTK